MCNPIRHIILYFQSVDKILRFNIGSSQDYIRSLRNTGQLILWRLEGIIT